MHDRQHQGLLPLELPLMHLEPHRSLAYISINFKNSPPQDQLLAAVLQAGGIVQSSYVKHSSTGQPGSQALLAVDVTGAANGTQGVLHELTRLPGVEGASATAPDQGLAAAEAHTVSVAGTPMVVIAREVLGGAFQHLSEAAGHEAVYRAGVEMGSLAASTVPPLLAHLERALTVDLLRRRVLDFQVFGWAVVKRVALDDSLQGELELDSTFESIPWHGKAPEPTCDFLRGFTTGVFSTAYARTFTSSESECQGKGDAVCRITFEPAA